MSYFLATDDLTSKKNKKNTRPDDFFLSAFCLEAERLTALAQEGNKDALEELVIMFKKLFKPVILKISKKQDYVTFDELKQLVMIGIFEAVKKYKIGLSNPIYFFWLCVSNCISKQIFKYRNGKGSFYKNLSPLDLLEYQTYRDLMRKRCDDPENEVITKEMVADIINFAKPSSGNLLFLESLVFYGHFILEKSREELSIDLGKKPKDISNSLARARKKIRKYYNERYKGVS